MAETYAHVDGPYSCASTDVQDVSWILKFCVGWIAVETNFKDMVHQVKSRHCQYRLTLWSQSPTCLVLPHHSVCKVLDIMSVALLYTSLTKSTCRRDKHDIVYLWHGVRQDELVERLETCDDDLDVPFSYVYS